MKKSWSAIMLSVYLLMASNASAALIMGVSIESVSAEFFGSGWDLGAIHTVDSSGLNSGGHDQVNIPGGNSWQTDTSTGTANIVFDLGNTYTMDSLHVWNLNFYSPYHGRGAKDVTISTSLNSTVWDSKGDVQFALATALDGDPGFDIDAHTWGQARYIQFDIHSNWAGYDNAGHVGLSEVRFFAADDQGSPVPIPSSMILLLTGILGLSRKNRRTK